MNQSCFTLGFLSQNFSGSSLSFVGIRGIYTRVRMECETSGFSKTGLARGLATWLDWVARSSREITERLVVLFCPVVLQLAWLFNFWHAWHVCCFWRLATASNSRDLDVRLCFLAHSWAFNTLSHLLPLQQTHLNTGLLIAEIQANLARNKANKMVE